MGAGEGGGAAVAGAPVVAQLVHVNRLTVDCLDKVNHLINRNNNKKKLKKQYFTIENKINILRNKGYVP